MGKADEVTHMVNNEPGQMLGVMEVLTLNEEQDKQGLQMNK